LNTIYQTYGGKQLYPSLEDKAANLLYFVVKNHSFVDGNKRIGAFLFIWFLNKNNYLFTGDGIRRISNETLVALTIMIAESNPKEKELVIKLIKHILQSGES
jgi:prophage maintenance system killer protein